VRRPDDYSKGALRILNELYSGLADDFAVVGSNLFGEIIPSGIIGIQGPLFNKLLKLVEVGLFRSHDDSLGKSVAIASNGVGGLGGRAKTLGFATSNIGQVRFTGPMLTSAGIELSKLLPVPDEKSLALRLLNHVPNLELAWLQTAARPSEQATILEFLRGDLAQLAARRLREKNVN